jgi:hypothetical protein
MKIEYFMYNLNRKLYLLLKMGCTFSSPTIAPQQVTKTTRPKSKTYSIRPSFKK